jgi:hypothetical protein
MNDSGASHCYPCNEGSFADRQTSTVCTCTSDLYDCATRAFNASLGMESDPHSAAICLFKFHSKKNRYISLLDAVNVSSESSPLMSCFCL